MHLSLTALAFSVGVVASASGAASELNASDPFAYTDIQDAVEYPTTNCDGLVLLAPREGTQFRDTTHVFPEGVESFFARAAERHATWMTTQSCSQRLDARAAASESTPPNAIQSGTPTFNWAGYQQNGHAARYAQAGWTVPTTTAPPAGHRYSPDGTYQASIWAGIGDGYPSNPPSTLIQAGTAQYVSVSGQTRYVFWYELLPTYTEISLPVAPGNAVSVAVAWQQVADSTHGEAWFGLCNETRNQCVSGIRSTSTNVLAPNGTAEWIVEAPGQVNRVSSLADFGSVTFHNICYAQSYTNGQPVGTCFPVTAPLSLYINLHYLNQDFGLTSNQGTPGSSFTVNYVVPEFGQ